MPEFDPIISFFESVKQNVPDQLQLKASLWLAVIRNPSPKIEKPVAAIREAATKKERDKLKKQLPAVTWSGTFTKRNSDNLNTYSGLICLDIDDLPSEQLLKEKNELSFDPFVWACFISPSGTGIKVIFRVSTGAEQHEAAWTALASYIYREYKLVVDTSGKDICRLCFLSHSPGLYYNPQSEVFDDQMMKIYTPVDPAEPEAPRTLANIPDQVSSPNPESDHTHHIAKCHEIVQRTAPAGPGTYNRYINLYSLQANRYGIPEADTLSELLHYCAPHDEKDTRAVVKNVYKNKAAEAGKYLQNSKRKLPAGTVPEIRENGGQYDDSVLFWYTIQKTDKATGEVTEEYKFSYDDAITFLHNNGFFKYRAGEGYRLIRVDQDNNIVDIVNELKIKEFMLEFLKSNSSQEYKKIREIFRRGARMYCSTNTLEGLDYYNPELRKDTPEAAYVYFQNCFLEITRAGSTVRRYADLEGFIWKKQVIEQDFTPCSWERGEFARFLWLAITGRKVDHPDEYDETEHKKFLSTCTGIGYLLHKYKNPTVTKTVIGVDRKTRAANDEVNGGSGKSLLSKAIGKMMNMLILDGPNFKFDDQFAFQRVGPDTEIINFNDVNAGFNFARLFGMITEEFTYNPKYQPSVTVPFSESPKFYISTNHTLKGDGESIRRRQHIIEFSDYFNADHTPAKEFGRMFFYDWDNEEWSRFYSFFIHCITLYLEHGLIDFPLENYALRKFLEWNRGAGHDLNEFLNETIRDQLVYTKEFEKKKLFEAFRENSGMHDLKQNTFSVQVEAWAKLNALEINAHKPDRRDRRNGVDYLIFTLLPEDPENDNDLDHSTDLL